MILWRISNHASLDGRGGVLASARWHTQGRPIVYLAETPASAMLEILVHLELDPASFPTNYKLLKAEAPDDLPVRSVLDRDLPEDWRHDLVVTRTLGDEWLARRTTALLRVPSAIVPETWNVLLNPLHPEAARISVVWYQGYPWDRRLVE